METLESAIWKNPRPMNEKQIDENNLCRLAKAIIEKQQCDYKTALEFLGNLKLNLICEERIKFSPSLQAALITAVNCGKRAFHGGVSVTMPANVPCLLPWPGAETINQLVIELGGNFCQPTYTESSHTLYFGKPANPVQDSLSVACSGWRGGVTSNHDLANLPSSDDFALGGILSGAIGVAKGFLRVSGLATRFVEAPYGISLWRPDLDWLSPEAAGPKLEFLPSRLWLMGLGHLGQAYLWTLGLLPYAQPEQLNLVLQDFDKVVHGNWTAGLLCEGKFIGRYKTRLCAEWVEQRGFKTKITERRFDSNTKRSGEEPFIALCGFDNAEARSLLENAGFDLVVECGLGSDTDQFDQILMHTFPESSRKPSELWASSQTAEFTKTKSIFLEAFHAKEDCGILAETLAQKAISSSFVGAVASTLVIGEVLRGLHGGNRYELIKTHLRTNDDLSAVSIQENYQIRLARSGFVLAQP
jgi:hypothetical protein